MVEPNAFTAHAHAGGADKDEELRPGPPASHPPEFGILEFHLDATPLSHQRRDRAAKALLKAAVAERFRNTGYLLSGEVQVAIDWYVSARQRWETDRTPDVDAIVKPLLDGMVGPQGLLIDDCQVQHVSCGWLDEGSRTERLRFEIRYSPDDWVRKHALAFVPVWESLCFPVWLDVDPTWALKSWEWLKERFAHRARGEELGVDPDLAGWVLPAQRAFHRTRVGELFRIIEADVYERKLRQLVGGP